GRCGWLPDCRGHQRSHRLSPRRIAVMRLSVIIPAFNEEKLITACVEKVFAAFRANAAEGWSGEVIVVDNNSTDRRAELGRAAGATVLFEQINQIARARNAGTRIASGDWFLFVD